MLWITLSMVGIMASKDLQEHLKEYTLEQADTMVRNHLGSMEVWEARRWTPIIVWFLIIILGFLLWFWFCGIADMMKHATFLLGILAFGTIIAAFVFLLI